MLQIGCKVPDFSCDAIKNGSIVKYNLYDNSEKYKLLFFYPLNFTFVCPTELHALQEEAAEFQKRNVEVLSISVDSPYSHLAWLNTPKTQGGIKGVTITMLSDITKAISRQYGVLCEEQGIAFRGVFLIDKNNILQFFSVNNLPLGRNISEIIRLVDALLHVEKHGMVCPVNWTLEKNSMSPTQKGLSEYFG
jgi:peroxiredoxin (alkyl hydroperoxide reductase subunit C)